MSYFLLHLFYPSIRIQHPPLLRLGGYGEEGGGVFEGIDRLRTSSGNLRQNGEADAALGQAILRNDGLPEELREVAPMLRRWLEKV